MKNLPNCICGGRPIYGNPRYAIGIIKCDKCGIRTKERHCDSTYYAIDRRNDWTSIMSLPNPWIDSKVNLPKLGTIHSDNSSETVIIVAVVMNENTDELHKYVTTGHLVKTYHGTRWYTSSGFKLHDVDMWQPLPKLPKGE